MPYSAWGYWSETGSCWRLASLPVLQPPISPIGFSRCDGAAGLLSPNRLFAPMGKKGNNIKVAMDRERPRARNVFDPYGSRLAFRNLKIGVQQWNGRTHVNLQPSTCASAAIAGS
ncbi:hypothetical protein EMEDMD4_610016 [Sinorhizobium medicae]|uniref:Uncharacterized protein n=1 Tax=Sinorhizobium medicae TaxID=110321 RepID=A0A508X9E3_9HYPH|nr:hypothetical protein EMEDMD4_610016 [Sinorhizobium medicae]